MIKTITLCFALTLAGCATGNKLPVQTYDFGIADPATPPPGQDVFVADVRAAEWLGSTDMLYRLEYRDPRVLTPYSASRWAGPPAAMLTTRLRLFVGNGMSARDKQTKCSLTLFLTEFSQVFKSEQESRAVLRLRATLSEPGSGQRASVREFSIERPAPSADAAGEAAAFAEVVKSSAEELNEWIDVSANCKE